jgi:hypothetical protein
MAIQTPEEKLAFVEEVIDDLRTHILQRVNKMPAEWDGIEMRRYMTDYFRLYVDLPSRMTGNTRRALDYKKALVTGNLL